MVKEYLSEFHFDVISFRSTFRSLISFFISFIIIQIFHSYHHVSTYSPDGLGVPSLPGEQRIVDVAFPKQHSPQNLPQVCGEAGDEGKAASFFSGMDWGTFGAPFGFMSPV